jgi:hypothetical protein
MGCVFSQPEYVMSPIGWHTVESNDVYIKTTDSSRMNPPAINPNYVSQNGESPHTYVGTPVDITLEIVVAEGLWPFIDLFGAPRLVSNPPVRCLTLDARKTDPGGSPIKLTPEVLNAFMQMLIGQNSQGLEIVKFSVQNIVLTDVSHSLGQAVEHMCNLTDVDLFSNRMGDKDVEVKTMCLYEKILNLL